MEELTLSEIINIIKKRKYYLLLLILVSVALTTVYLSKATPVYQATTKVLIESKPQKTIAIEDILVPGSQDKEYFKTQYSLFQSRTLIKKLLIKLDLLESDEFNQQPLINLFPLKDWLKSTMITVGLIVENQQAENIPKDPYSPLIDQFLKRLEVVPTLKSKIVSIGFQGYSPILTARITNTLVDLYIQDQDEYQKGLETDAEKWLKSQGKQLSKGLQQSNSKVQDYIKNKNMIELDDKRNFANQQYRETLTEANKIKTRIRKLKSLIQQLEGFESSPKQLFFSIPESLKDEAIITLRASYLDEVIKHENLSKNLEPSHPRRIQSKQKLEAIEARIPGEVDRLSRSLKADFRALQKQEMDLNLLQREQKSALMELDKKKIKFKQIEEEAQSNKKLLDQLMNRGKKLGVISSYYVPPLRIVDRAEIPTRPIKPQKGVLLILALSFGIFVGLILVFFLESQDKAIKNEDDVNRQLPYPLLGSIGLYKKNGIIGSSKDTASKIKDEFQNLRTKFLPLLEESPGKVFIVTSTFPGEGKATVTSHLAVALGEVGKKILIIDADLENPKIHSGFKTLKNPGIINILSNSNTSKPTPVETKKTGVWVIPSDGPSHNSSPSPDVLFSLALPSLLDELKNDFDLILIKTAPVLCGTHARIIENFCDGILFVMASGRSDKKTILDMVNHLASTPVEIKKRRFLNGDENRVPHLPGETNSSLKNFRIVLTKVKDKQEEQYGYGNHKKVPFGSIN